MDVKIGTIRSRTDISPEGGFVEYYQVEYFIDDARHTFRMSPEGFTAEKAEEEVRKRASELLKVQGKKLTVTKQ